MIKPIFNEAAIAPYLLAPTAAVQPPEALRTPPDSRASTCPLMDRSGILTGFMGKERIDFVDGLLASSAAGHPTATILLATRRAGKTSLVRYLEEKAKNVGSQVRVIALNGMGINYSEGENVFYESMFLHHSRQSDLRDIVGSAPDNPGHAFWKRLEELSRSDPVVLALDEPYPFIKGDRNFFRTWRNLYDGGSNISLLFTSFSEALVAVLEEHSHLAQTGFFSSSLNVAQEIGLPLFTVEDGARMLLHRLFEAGSEFTFSPGFLEFVRVISGGNPYLIETVAGRLYNIARSKGEDSVDWRVFGEHKLAAPDYFKILPYLAQRTLDGFSKVSEAFDNIRFTDNSAKFLYDDDEDVQGAFKPGMFFKALVTNLLFSGTLVFDPYRIFDQADMKEVGTINGECYKHWLNYLEKTEILKRTFDERGRVRYKLNQFPFLSFAQHHELHSTQLRSFINRFGLRNKIGVEYGSPRMDVSFDGKAIVPVTNDGDTPASDEQLEQGLVLDISTTELVQFWFTHHPEL